MIRESVGMIVGHLQEHLAIYIGFTLAFWSYLIYTFALKVRFFSVTRDYPGPGHGHWFFGQLGNITKQAPGVAQMNWHRKYGNVVRFSGLLPGYESISFTSYSALKTILVDRAYEFPKPPFVRNVLGITAGYGLLTLEGPDHQAQRRFMNQAFAFKYLHEQFETYYTPINSLMDILSEKIKKDPNADKEEGTVLEISHYINNCLMDIICLTAFGYECDSLNNADQPLANAYHTLVNLQNTKNMMVLFAILNMPFGPFLAQRAVKSRRGGKILSMIDKALGKYSPQHLKLMLTFVDNVYIVKQISSQLLEEKLVEARELKKAGNFAIDATGAKVDVLSLLVRSSLDESSPYKMDSDMMEQQVLTFLGAGHETTASGAAWAIWELSSRPEVQNKLRQECQELIARNANPGYQEIKQLQYLHCFVQEIMRLRPPTPQTAREASQNSTVDGIFIPKGMSVYIPSRAINQDKNVWGPDADEFKPERWLNLPEKYDSTFSILTFIAGPHKCIGMQMAMLELKAILCSLVSHFELIQAQDLPEETSAITMKPVGGITVRIRKLDPNDSIKRYASLALLVALVN